ncbi:MAG: LysR substrate-binding domain-containing protein, partial [Pseudomonadota bacterium]
AARLGGFAAAANELCVTPGAVTQHIKSLESWIGAPLFQRRSQGVVLTRLGESAVQEFSDAFDQLGNAVQTLRIRAVPDTLRIAVLPSVAQLWLQPRLPALHRALPDLKFSISAIESPPNLLRDAYDFSLFFFDDPLPDGAIEVCRDEIFPVCAPPLATKLRSLRDLEAVPLLQDTKWAQDWKLWLAAIDPALRLSLEGPNFSLYSLAVEEAKNGAGVLFGHAPLVERDLANDSLVHPFGAKVTLPRSLAILPSSAFADSPNLSTLLETLLHTTAGGEMPTI